MNCSPDIHVLKLPPVPNIPPGYHYGYISTYSLVLKIFKEPGFGIQPMVSPTKGKVKEPADTGSFMKKSGSKTGFKSPQPAVL